VPPAVAPQMPVLRRGSTGSAVKVAQLALKVAADGYFGPLTERAVEKFQEAEGLAIDGIIGPYTWRMLLEKPPVEGDWIEGITATVFGGVSDNEMSAYDGKLLNDTDLYVALPDRFEGTRPMVEVRVGDKTQTASVQDVGPWVVDDPYWTTGARPVAETCYQTRTPLPHGPNKGKIPTNPAGIDLSLALAKALGVAGKGLVAFRLVS
jgi:peptidoglycan hydrolase-like protein with peptidoglycan-binding domain